MHLINLMTMNLFKFYDFLTYFIEAKVIVAYTLTKKKTMSVMLQFDEFTYKLGAQKEKSASTTGLNFKFYNS